MPRSVARIVLLGVLLSGIPHTAEAASISKISWTVTGGIFGGAALAIGPITGGSLTWTPFGGSIVTSPGTAASGSGIWTLSLTGPAGFFGVAGPGGVFLINPVSAAGSFTAVVPAFSGTGGGFTVPTVVAFARSFAAIGGFGSGLLAHVSMPAGAPVTHSFLLGAEVRTAVPAPAAGPLVGLGLIGLGAAAVRSRRRRPA